MKKYAIFPLSGILLLVLSCISEYAPKIGNNTAGVLVVEGVISDTGTFVKLSRTVKMDDSLSIFESEFVDNATIHVIDEGFNVIAVAEQQKIDGLTISGTYIVKDSISFTPGKKYALDMQIGGKQYRSDFVTPVFTPEIDEVNWRLNDDYSIDFFVSTHDSEKQINYYLWNFEENWEYKSWEYAFCWYDPSTKILWSTDTIGVNRFFCWDSDYSKRFLLASSIHTDYVIKNHKIHSIQPGTSRHSYLYCISVRQYGLDRETFRYFDTMQKNVDEVGSLFGLLPAERKGNIQCLSNPKEIVIGYVFASKQTIYRLYIPMAELGLDDFEDTGKISCGRMIFDNPSVAFSRGYGNITPSLYTNLKCVDCTYRGGTKNKPTFWPNNHQ